MVDKIALSTIKYPRVVYRGPHPTIQFKGFRFLRDVPRWFQRWKIPDLPDGFDLFHGPEPDVEKGPDILVRMPSALCDYVAAETALHRLEVAFPTSEIHLLVRKGLSEIPTTHRVYTTLSQTKQAQYHQVFDLTWTSLKLRYGTAHKLKWPWWMICILALGFYDAQLDEKSDQIVPHIRRPSEGFVQVCRDGIKSSNTQPGADLVIEALKKVFPDVRVFSAHQADPTTKEMEKDPERLGGMVEQVRHAGVYIGLGDSHWNYVAAYGGVPSLIFHPKTPLYTGHRAHHEKSEDLLGIMWRQQAAADHVSVADIVPLDDMGIQALEAIAQWVTGHMREVKHAES